MYQYFIQLLTYKTKENSLINYDIFGRIIKCTILTLINDSKYWIFCVFHDTNAPSKHQGKQFITLLSRAHHLAEDSKSSFQGQRISLVKLKCTDDSSLQQLLYKGQITSRRRHGKVDSSFNNDWRLKICSLGTP